MRILDSQFTRFALIGGIGLGVDLLMLQLAVAAGCGVFSGRALSFVAAASFTWQCNRHFTFGTATDSTSRSWSRYMAAMLAGGALNYAVFTAIIVSVPGGAVLRSVAVAAGALCGMGLNYFNARYLVFRAETVRNDT